MAKTKDPFTLFDLSDAIKAIIADIVEADIRGDKDELEALYAELDEHYDARADKLEGYVYVIKNSLATSANHKEVAEEYDVRATALKNLAKRLKERLLYDLEQHGEESVIAGDFKIRRQKNSVPSLKISIEETELPEEYQVVEIEADNDALREALERGEKIKGVVLERGEHIRIRVK